jgi:copper resistance protein D
VGDATLPLLRLPQYLSLMLLFGLPFLQRQAVRTGVGVLPATFRRWVAAACSVALLMQLLELPVQTLRMLGLPWQELDGPALSWYMLDTPAGLAWVARSGALLAMAFWLILPGTRDRTTGAFLLLAGGALSALLWNGHAAASGGVAGGLRLFIGGLHLLAASVWLGAIAGFVLLFAQRTSRDHLYPMLHGFANTGSVLVAVLLATGILHYAWIHGWQATPTLFPLQAYDRWMLVKLILFSAMLVLAGLHRWWLVPRLRFPAGAMALRNSLRVELSLGVGVVAAVAILGTMSPSS